jgi:hypothetical protein
VEILVLENIDLADVGNYVNLTATLWRDKRDGKVFIVPLSADEYEPEYDNLALMLLDTHDSIRLVNQALLLEGRRYDGIRGTCTTTALARMRKQVEPKIMWNVFRRDNFTCVYCGDDEGPMTFDHFIPESQGGAITVENGRTACRPCNSMKGDMEAERWLECQKLRHRKAWLQKRKQRRADKNVNTSAV